jgi:hypothetical protein
MAAGKLSEILTQLYTIIEALTPFYESDKAFTRWTSLEDMSTADPSPSFRAFRLAVVFTGKGTVSSGATMRSKLARVDVLVNYPRAHFDPLDTNYLGVEAIRADDDALIVARLAMSRPLVLQDNVTNVRAPKWLGSAVSGRLWVISFEFEYLEEVP